MFLDALKLRRIVFQLQYAPAYELWDQAGAVSRRMSKIWPALSVSVGEPNRVVLKAPGVSVRTELETSILVLSGMDRLDTRTSQQICDAVDCWRDVLDLKEFSRVSMLVEYIKEYPSLPEANADVFRLNLVKWPKGKVFDQPIDGLKNGVEVTYRFEDDSSFTVVRLKAQGLLYEQQADPEFFEEEVIRREKNRMILEFDRGIIRSVSSDSFRTDEWLKGYFHVLRRDIEKVLISP